MIVSISAIVLVNFLRTFAMPKNAYLVLLLPIAIFPSGFFLRLTGGKEIVDVGSFLTEFGFLFVYVIFASSFVLGQIK